MSDKEERLSLAAQIKGKAKKLDKSLIKKKLKAASYSQPLNRIAEMKKLKNNIAIMKYAWPTEKSIKEEKGIETIGSVSMKKKTTSAKAKDPGIQSISASKQAPAKSQSANPIATNKATEYPTSDFAQWLNTKVASPSIDELNHQNSEDMSKGKKDQKKENKKKSADKSESKKSKRGKEEAELAKKKKKSKKKKTKSEAKDLKKDKKKKSKAKSALKQKIEASVKKKDEIATITLAKLYEDQGYYKKAMDTYKQLSLINPEKSSFFAPLIEDLKNKLK